MNISLLRSLSLLAFASAALSAPAYVIQIAGTINSSNIVTGTTFQFSDLPQFGSSFGYFFNVNGAGALTASYSGSGGAVLSLLSVPGSPSISSAGGVFTYSGAYTVTGSTNVNSVPIGTFGTYSGNFDTPRGIFFLNVQSSVPGPAAMAPFALGALATLRKRRRKA